MDQYNLIIKGSQPSSDPMSVDECRAYIKQPITPNIRYQHLEYDTAGDVDQFSSMRIYKDLKSKQMPSLTDNLFRDMRILPQIWHKNKNIDSRAVDNTFKYIFNKLKKGIFIRIADNKLQTFIPFHNIHYKNEFGHMLKVDPRYGSINDFLNHISKLLGYRGSRQQDIKPFDEWVANNSLVRYEVEKDTSIAGCSANNKITLLNMFMTLCEERDVPDIEFFMNRRDHPQMKIDGTEPYNHIWGSKHHPLVSHNYDTYAPILSGSTTEMHADINVPTYEDWARATYQISGKVFPNACREYPDIQLTPWSKKIGKAVFRGATTGSGVTTDTNQRLKALEIGAAHSDVLDVGITKWNMRVRKIEGSKYLQTIERKSYPKANKLSLQEQSLYKYILTLEGHVAAYRLSYELSSGSVVLLAKSQWQIWYYPFLKEYIHYVPVKEDLSDLLSQINWCKAHDSECAQIADNARKFYNKYLGTRGILDFIQKELWELSEETKVYKYLPNLLTWSVEDERRQLEHVLEFTNHVYNYPLPDSPRCVGSLDAVMHVMRSKSINELKWIEKVFENVNGRIDLFTTNGFKVIGKRSNNQYKALEHIHENYIGIKAINKLVSRVPNFAYIFGPLKDEQDMVFVEYIEGITLMNWLKSKYYNFNDFLSIMVQLNLALSVAQNYIGFIHYDLFPWNVMIQNASSAKYYTRSNTNEFTYFLNFQTDKEGITKQNMVSIKSGIIPIIIDYGKSRAIVYEQKYGTIDHGFTNLYKQNSIIDTLTILYGSLIVLDSIGRLGKNEKKLLDFPKRLGLESADDIKRWSKFNALNDFKAKTKTGENAVPKNFIDFVISTFKTPKLSYAPNLEYAMEKGVNPLIAEAFMKYNNKEQALIEMIKHVDTSRPPVSDNKFFQLVIQNILQRKIGWVDDQMAAGSTETKRKWAIVRKLLTNNQPRPESAMPDMDFPKPVSVYLDDAVSYEYIKSYNAEWISHDDWMLTWIMCLEAFLFGVVTDEGDYGQFIKLNGFLYHNAVASNNTMLKLKTLLTGITMDTMSNGMNVPKYAFDIVSGTAVWGQIDTIMEGVMNYRKNINTVTNCNGLTHCQVNHAYQTKIKKGEWYRTIETIDHEEDDKQTYVIYHHKENPVINLKQILEDVSFSWNQDYTKKSIYVNRYDWGYHHHSEFKKNDTESTDFYLIDIDSVSPLYDDMIKILEESYDEDEEDEEIKNLINLIKRIGINGVYDTTFSESEWLYGIMLFNDNNELITFIITDELEYC